MWGGGLEGRGCAPPRTTSTRTTSAFSGVIRMLILMKMTMITILRTRMMVIMLLKTKVMIMMMMMPSLKV